MSLTPLVDTHCHLDFKQYDGDRTDVLETCAERMAAVVNVGTNADRNAASLQLAQERDVVHATMGLHPTYEELFDSEQVDAVIDQVAEHADDIVAVGEIGLDYHHVREAERREQQAVVFRRLLALAEAQDIPVVTHTRDAEQDALDILNDFDPVQVVMHCFNGNPDLATECVDRGYFVSISTQVTYSDRVQAIADAVPLEHILLETDAPFLWRDGRNVPWHVEHSAERIARIKELEPDEVAAQTARNACTALPALSD